MAYSRSKLKSKGDSANYDIWLEFCKYKTAHISFQNNYFLELVHNSVQIFHKFIEYI